MAPAEQRNVAGYVTLLPTRFLKEAMKHYAGLDVSLSNKPQVIVNKTGKICRELKVICCECWMALPGLW